MECVQALELVSYVHILVLLFKGMALANYLSISKHWFSYLEHRNHGNICFIGRQLVGTQMLAIITRKEE